jgi:hypothetical protein
LSTGSFRHRYHRWRRVARQGLALSRAEEKEPVALLGNAEVRRVQRLVRLNHCVSGVLEFRNQLMQDARMSTLHHSWHVLHNEVARLNCRNEAEEVEDELVPRIVDKALADQRKSLTGRPTTNQIDLVGPVTPVGDGPLSGCL